MLIHLMQHGACLSEEIDPARPLSPMGRDQVIKSARAARIMGLRFELVAASPKLRSLQTAEIMAEGTGYPLSRIQRTDVVKAMTPPLDTIAFIKEYEGLDSILITGHLPSLAKVASTLLTGREDLAVVMENGGLMQISLDAEAKQAALNWALSPAQLAIMGAD